MKEFPLNSILHNACEVFITELLMIKNRDLHVYLLKEVKLYYLLRKELQMELKKRREGVSSNCGYIGVVWDLCCMVEGVIENEGLEMEKKEVEMEEGVWSEEDVQLYEEYKDLNVRQSGESEE